MNWVRDRSLGLFFIALFVLTWLAQLFVEWQRFVSEQEAHQQTAEFWSGEFWVEFWQSTLENWQSEFLQLGSFVIAAAYFVYKGSSESPDSSERLEAKIDALLQEQGIKPSDIDRKLEPQYRRKVAAKA
ncbi:MAG: hypothetical protein ICV70_00255 [Jiangellaceae bacterium]|nr:hypothetical protein [Jiangellaceae bacterium]